MKFGPAKVGGFRAKLMKVYNEWDKQNKILQLEKELEKLKK